MSAVQRVRSLERPSMSLDAAMSRLSMRSAFSFRSCCSALFSWKLLFSDSSSELSRTTSSCVLARSFDAMRSDFSASATFLRLGSTVLATAW